ncbi:hypothetical protein FHG87_020326 [Trinorchestia longiramus]|nr:hypothetical protein FHG87_020326 [Trinorchestia longiramus]
MIFKSPCQRCITCVQRVSLRFSGSICISNTRGCACVSIRATAEMLSSVNDATAQCFNYATVQSSSSKIQAGNPKRKSQSGVSSLSSDVRNTGAAEHASLPVLVSNNPASCRLSFSCGQRLSNSSWLCELRSWIALSSCPLN